MKRNFEICATGSGFGGRIATIRTMVEFDDAEPLDTFYTKACSAVFRAGYNVLHWRGVNGLDAGRCLFVALKNETLAKRLIADLADYKFYGDAISAIEQSEKTGKESEKTFCYKGKWGYKGGWTKESAMRSLERCKAKIETTCLVLDELGYDPHDREGVRRVCENMGMYRV